MQDQLTHTNTIHKKLAQKEFALSTAGMMLFWQQVKTKPGQEPVVSNES